MGVPEYVFFLAKDCIPSKFEWFRPNKCHALIHEMLMRIPLIPPDGMQSHFNTIDSRFSDELEVDNNPTLLELAIWKSNITKQFDTISDTPPIDTKIQCLVDSLMMVTIIVPDVMLFLECAEENCGNYDQFRQQQR